MEKRKDMDVLYVVDKNGRECIKCGVYKRFDEGHFQKNDKMKTGYIRICKQCNYEAHKKLYISKPCDKTCFNKDANQKLLKIFGYKKYFVVPQIGGYFKIKCFTKSGVFIKFKIGEFNKPQVTEWLRQQETQNKE